MNNQYDPLLELFQLCDGMISININDHRNDYTSVSNYLRNNRFAVIQETARLKIIENDRFVELVFVPVLDNRQTVRMYGHSLHEVCTRAVYHVRKMKHVLMLQHPSGVVNITSLLDELAATCLGSVHVEINPFKGRWWDIEKEEHVWDGTAKTYLRDRETMHPDDFEPDEEGDVEISPAERQAMEEMNQTLRVHFYPNTPVGFYAWYDTDLGDMLERAVTQAKASTKFQNHCNFN